MDRISAVAKRAADIKRDLARNGKALERREHPPGGSQASESSVLTAREQ
jgi:hypothetical protein